MLKLISIALIIGALRAGTASLELPGSCSNEQFYDPGLLKCQACPANASMIKASDGFSCTCNEHSIPSGSGCKTCSATEVVSSDGSACVPRKCHHAAGRVACRKCPNEYISVTQNFDGTPMKEVQCVKCARGYRAQGNQCVRCEHCVCNKTHVTVRGTCVPRMYVNARATYEDKALHPLELLDVVKHEHLCTTNDVHMCRLLTDDCVRNFYSSDLGGPCRLWLQPKLTPHGLPPLLVSPSNKNPGEMSLPRGQSTISLAVAIFGTDVVKFMSSPDDKKIPCGLPLKITIGENWSRDCSLNLTKFSFIEGHVIRGLSPYLVVDGEYKPLHLRVRKPNGYYVQKGSWPSEWFNRFFIVHKYLSTVSNVTNTIYLRALLIRIRINRDRAAASSLRLHVGIEAQYANGDREGVVTTSLKVLHDLPSAGVMRGLEICGGILGSFLAVYGLIQWRGALRRGALHYTLLPIIAGAVADTLYFAASFSTLHALAAEAGTLGMTLPLSDEEERMIKAFIYSAVALKFLKVAWLIWKQIICDVFFLDWSEYNQPVIKDPLQNDDVWKRTTLAREWSRVQTMRRASPGYTVTGTMLFLHILTPWQAILPKSEAYKWAVASIGWWSSYTTVLLVSSMYHRVMVCSPSELPRVCAKVGLSLMVFEEELYAHYVHGRNEDTNEVRSMAGPLATCRVSCVPQLRVVYKQLSSAGFLSEEGESKQGLLSKFLAAFFERALDGLNWVASERTVFERLLDVELTSRESGSTSALLYDDDKTPSCFAVTWWGSEWHLSTFDAMVFSAVLMGTGDVVLAAAVTIVVWQVLKQIRTWFGNRNQVEKTHVGIYYPSE